MTSRSARWSLLGLLLLALLPDSSLFAQVVNGPPRTPRPARREQAPDARGIRHNVNLNASMFGAYDEGGTPFSSQDAALLRPGGYGGFADASMDYSIGSGNQSLRLVGNGFVNGYRPSANAAPTYGSDLSAGGQTQLGQRTTLSGSQSYHYAPYSSLGLFAAGRADTDSLANPDGNPANGVIRGAMWTANSSATLARQWTRRTTMTANYAYGSRGSENDALVDGHTQAGGLQLSQQIGRSVSLQTSYNLSDSRLTQNESETRTAAHGMDGGVSVVRQISPTRTIMITGGGGVRWIDSRDKVRQRYHSPTAYALVSVDLGRSWVAAVDYRQSVSGLPVPVFSRHTFLARNALVSIGGGVGSRLNLAFNVATAGGAVALGAVDDGGGSYRGYTGTAQLRAQLTRSLSVIANVTRYQTRLSGAAAEAFQVSPTFHRDSVRIGLGWNFPLVGNRPVREAQRD